MIWQKLYQPSSPLSLWDSVIPSQMGLQQVFITYTVTKLVKGEAKEVHSMIWILDALFILNFISMALH